MEFPPKIKNRVTSWSTSSTLGIYPNEKRKKENTNSESYLYPHIPCNIIYNSQNMELPKYPWCMNEYRRCDAYMKWNIIPLKKKENLTTTWMDLEGIRLNNTGHRKTNTKWCHLYVEPQNHHHHNNSNHKLLIEKETRFVVTKDRGLGEGTTEPRWSKGTNF